MTPAAAGDCAAAAQRRTIRVGRGLLFAAGLAIVVWLIHIVRGQRIVVLFHEAGRWVPLVALLELAIVGTDFLSIRALLGDARAKVSPLIWVRATALAYASSIFLPLGRAAGEAVRAANLQGSLGAAFAVRQCARLQACALVGNAAISLFGIAVTFHALKSQMIFGAALLGNALVCATLATGLLLGLRSGRLAQWFGRRFSRFGRDAVSAAGEVRPGNRTIVATLLCVSGRFVQAAQYGAVLAAVGCNVTPARAFLAQDIQLVGAAAGDLVPNQMGATESAFFLFGKSVGLTDDASRMVAMALLMRLVQVGLAAACVFLIAMMHDDRVDQRT